MSESDKNDIWTHRPLPYVVCLRAVSDEDAPPQTTTHRTVAYSVLEAVAQVMMIASGGMLDTPATKYHIESVEPDLPAFLDSLTKQLAAVRPA